MRIMERKSSKGSKKIADKHGSGREEEEGRAFSDQRSRNKLEKEKPKGKHSSGQQQMGEMKSSASNKLPENQSQKRKHRSSIEETHVSAAGSNRSRHTRRFDGIVEEEEEEETEAGVHLQRSLNEKEKPKREHSRSQPCEASSKPQVKETKSPRSNNQPTENQNQKRKHQSKIQEIQVTGAGSIRSRGEQRSVDKLEKHQPKRKHSRIQPSAAFSSQQIEEIKSPGSSKQPEKQSWERKHQSRTQETQVSGAESNGSLRVAHLELRSTEKLEEEKPKRKHSRVPLSAAASSSPQVEEIKSPGSNNPPEKQTQIIKHQSSTHGTQVSASVSSNPPTNQKQQSRIPETQVAAAAGSNSSQPLRHFAGIIGECRGPFEHKLTSSDSFEHWLSITKQNYTEFFKPFFGNNDGHGTNVTLCNAEDGMSREYYLTLKFWGPKCVLDGVWKRDREWNGDGEWKRFREEHKSLIKVNGIIKIWIFRHARNGRIYCVITPGTGDSLESSKPIPNDQKRRSSTWKN